MNTTKSYVADIAIDLDNFTVVENQDPNSLCSKQLYLRVDGKTGFEDKCRMEWIVDDTVCYSGFIFTFFMVLKLERDLDETRKSTFEVSVYALSDVLCKQNPFFRSTLSWLGVLFSNKREIKYSE